LVKVIRGGTLVDGTGKEPIKDCMVVIEGSTIVAVGKENEMEIPKEAVIIETDHKVVMPGLIDAELHLMGEKTEPPVPLQRVTGGSIPLRAIRAAVDARNLLYAGYTAIRDLGSYSSTSAIALKRAIEEGTVQGPRIMAAIWLNSTSSPLIESQVISKEWLSASSAWHPPIDGVVECIRAVRQAISDGADLIKIMTTGGTMKKESPKAAARPTWTIEEIRAIVTESHRLGVRVAAHAVAGKGIRNAIEGGVDTIEHGFHADREDFRMMVERNIILVPTLSAVYRMSKSETLPSYVVERAKKQLQQGLKGVKKALKAGVMIASGSDQPFEQGAENALELELLVKAGMTEMKAIKAATKIGAKAWGDDENVIGTVEEGKLADIIIVNGNPCKDIKILQDKENIGLVMKGGEIIVNRGVETS